MTSSCDGSVRIIVQVIATSKPRRTRDERERIVLDVAARLFYSRGVHEVGMDALVAETRLGKATVYRLFPTKDQLVGAYLGRLATQIFSAIDLDVAAAAGPADALHTVIDAIAADLARPEFRGCPFNNASIEYSNPAHPAREAARDYRTELTARLVALGERLTGNTTTGTQLGHHLAVLIDGAYTNTAHLGPDGPAQAGLDLARRLIDQTARHTGRSQS